MTATLMAEGRQSYADANGNPLAGGKLYTYAAGTSTPLATYSDAAGLVPNANPVVLDARGEATVFWGSAAYKVVLKDSADVTVWTQDNLTVRGLVTATGASTARTLEDHLATLPDALITATGTTTGRAFKDCAADVFSVASFGALGDGTDETTEIQSAMTAAAGRKLIFPEPSVRYYVTGTISVPSNVDVVGSGKGGIEIQVPAGTSFPAFDVDGSSRVTIGGFRFTKAAGAALTGAAAGVRVRGNAADVVVEDCHAAGFVEGFKVAGQEGTTPGTARRISFVRCKSDDSPSLWGFDVDDADGVTFTDCHATGNWLDGFKLRKKTLNVTILGGSSTGNGVGYLSNPALYAGDGLDAYAGGDTFLINGFTVESNYGSGLTIKTGELTKTDAVNYGYVRNVQLIGVRSRFNSVGAGLYLTDNNPTDLAEPIVNAVSIVGGVWEGNGEQGMYIGGRNVSIVGPLIRDNGDDGIFVTLRAMDVEITSPVVTGNGRSSAGNFNGITISGTRVRVRGGVYNGADAATVAVNGDYAALTKYTHWPVRVTSDASDVDVEIDSPVNHTATTVPVQVEMTAGRCTLRLRGADVPTNGGFGSVGSTWTRTDAGTPEDVEWVKTSGNPNAITGWQRRVDAHGVFIRGNADLALGTNTARTLIWNAALTADRTCTLPAASLYAGMRFRISRLASSTGAFNLNVSDGSTLKALATAQWCDVEYTGSAWTLVGFGSL